MAIAPFGQVTRRLDGSYSGVPLAVRHTVSNPDSPSIMTSRASAEVRATSATRFLPPFTCCLTHSAPARVLPNPRPAIRSQVRHGTPVGACWLGRPTNRQSRTSASSCSGVRQNCCRRVAWVWVSRLASVCSVDSGDESIDVDPYLPLHRGGHLHLAPVAVAPVALFGL